MGVFARTPNRIDLAGGTLDIYPLYLFEEEAVTVNIAIQVYSTAELERRPDRKIEIHSRDLNKTVTCQSLEECVPQGELDLLIRAVRQYPPEGGINLQTHNEAPQGSGIGASSALLMAVSAALNELNKTHLTVDEMIDIGANLEAQTIRIPTGKQDYLAAMHGGINACWFNASGFRVEPILYSEKEVRDLESRIVLSYTGIPHFSGENNWTIMHRYIDGESSTVRALRQIKTTALRMREAVRARAWDEIGKALKEEWENRKALAVGVTTPVVEHLMAKAREGGGEASKLCGAGGGGCMITWVELERRKAVEDILKGEGADLLPFRVEVRGLEVREETSVTPR